MQPSHSIQRRVWYPWAFLGVTVIASALLYAWKKEALAAELVLSVLGAIAAFFHFLYSQHNSNTDRFIALFKTFNERFDKLNDSLNHIQSRQATEVLKPEERQTLFDYFNLCAEEYLFFKGGYIDGEVWNSWLRGMAFFASNPEIRRVWESELRQGSYYGFSLSLLPSAA